MGRLSDADRSRANLARPALPPERCATRLPPISAPPPFADAAHQAVAGSNPLLPRTRASGAIWSLWQFLSFDETLVVRPPPPEASLRVWSLCVEWRFYLLFPAAVALFSIRPSASKTLSVILAVLPVGIGPSRHGHGWTVCLPASPPR